MSAWPSLPSWPDRLTRSLSMPSYAVTSSGLGCSRCKVLQGLLDPADDVITLRKAMTLGERFGVVVGQPNLAPGILPDEGLERKVDADALTALHQRCAHLGTGEDQ